MNSHWKAVVGVILIYLFGCLSGVFLTGIVVHHKMQEFLKHPAVAVSAALEKRLTGNLDLDANQKQQVHQYFVENLEKRKEIQQQNQPQVQMLNRQTFMEINGVLRPDQTERFHQNIAEFRKHFGAAGLNPDTENQPPPSK